MTTVTELAVPASARPTSISQATSVEQSRAVAEVQAAAVIANQNPRSKQRAVAEMAEECALEYVAQRAFYRYRRGGEQVTGGSIHLAKGLARCWQNIAYGTSELSRNDALGESEMSAWAWDLEANNRVSITFTVKHTRDTTDGPVRLTSGRDIYEHLTNQANRRMREQIFAVLPAWFVDQATQLCTQTLEHGGGVPLGTRIGRAIDHYATRFNVTQKQLERRVGRPADEWTAQDLAELAVLSTALTNGELQVDTEFDTGGLSVTDITPTAAAAPTPAESNVDTVTEGRDSDADRRPDPTPAVGAAKARAIEALADAFDADGWSDDDAGRLEWLTRFVKSSTPVASYAALTVKQLTAAAEFLASPSDVAVTDTPPDSDPGHADGDNQ